MKTPRHPRRLLAECGLALCAGMLAGVASAVFLWALDRVTAIRWENGWLLYLLPVAGFLVVWVYQRIGQSAEGGNNLILERIHEPGGGVPLRMAPLVLLGTLLTHLCGGSAGREGTAVQMGGSLADGLRRLLRVGPEHQRMLLMAGVAGGFGAVFGTPVTGAIFAMEVLVIGRMDYRALVPVLLASIAGDLTCQSLGARHTSYAIAIDGVARLDPKLLLFSAVGGVVFGLVSKLFVGMTHGLKAVWAKATPRATLRPVLGGLVVIALVAIVGTRDYLGLGVTSPDPGAVTIVSCFEPGGATPWSWWWKLVFTAVTLSCGFKGGEVTPLFFIGAALGNLFGSVAGLPVDLFAGLGFIAVFAGATNIPLACTMMGIELFGAHHAVYFAVACFVAYHVSGHPGIYSAQRVEAGK